MPLATTIHTPWVLANEEESLALGRRLIAAMPPSGDFLLHLHGPLGAGKTTLVRGMLYALGHHEPVKSPTFGLLEIYTLGERIFYHADLYRLRYQEEWVDAGLADAFSAPGLKVIEWPERAAVPTADIEVHLAFAATGREVDCRPQSTSGYQWLARANIVAT